MTNQMVKKLTTGILFSVLMLALAMTAVLSVTSESTAYADGHTHDGVNFNPWNSSYDLPTSSGNYYLTTDVDISYWDIENDVTIRLCLNEHTISVGGSIVVYESCTLAIYDENAGTGKIIAADEDATTGFYLRETSTFYLYGGEISGFKDYGIYSESTDIYLYGGKIANNSRSGYGKGVGIWHSDTKLHLSDTVFSGNTNGDIYFNNSQIIYVEGAMSGNVSIDINGAFRTFTSGWSTHMSGKNPSDYFTPTNGVAALNSSGEVQAVNANTSHVHDGVYFDQEWSTADALPTSAGNYYLTADVTLSDRWEIEGNKTISLCLNGHTVTSNGGSAIGVFGGCTLAIYDDTGEGKIIANNGSITGLNLYENSTFYLYGGEISGFKENGICAFRSDVYLYGGKIADNCQNTYGKGFAIWESGLHLSGTVFSGNTHGDIFVDDNQVIYIEGALSGNINIDINGALRTITSGWSTYMDGEDPADYFTFTVGIPALDEDGEVEAIIPPHIHNGITFERWDIPYDLPSSGSYYLDTDVSTEYYWSINDYAELNLCLNGHTITFTSVDSYCIGVSEWDDHKAATLKIYDDTGNGVITTTYTGDDSRFINVGSTYYEEGQHFYLYGGKITGFKKGVIANRGYDYLTAGSVHLCGGEICDNDSYDIELSGGIVITIGGALTEGSPIVVSTVDYAFTSGWDDNMSGEDPADYFVFTDNNYFAVLNSNGEVQAHAHNWTYSANGNVITEHCTADSCPLSDRTLTLSASGKDYDGTAVVASYVVSDGWQGGSPEISYTGNTNAGTYTASVTVGGAEATVQFTISKATPSYTIPTGLAATYGDTLADVTLPAGWTWNASETSVGNVGSHTFAATFTPADTANYNTIEQNLTVTVNANDKTALLTAIGNANAFYDTIATEHPEIAATLQEAIDAATAVKNDDNKTVEEIAAAVTTLNNAVDQAEADVDQAKADAVKALIEAIDDLIVYPNSKDAIDAAREAYDALTNEQKALVDNLDDLTDAEEAYAVLKADHDAADAVDDVIEEIGEVAFTPESKEKIEAAREAFDALTDEQKALTNEDDLIAAEEAYAALIDAHIDSLIPTGLAATYGQTLADVSLPDGWTWNEESTKIGNVGSNNFAATYTSEDTSIAPASREIIVTVGAKAVTVTIDAKTSVYGSAKAILTATDDGILAGDTNVYSLSCDVSATSSVGAYSITGTALSDNYDITFVGGENAYTVTKKALTVTAENKNILFGDDVPTYTATYDGFVHSETKTALTGTLTFSCAYKKGDDAGKYDITPSGLTSNNYAITFVKGTLSVKTNTIKDQPTQVQVKIESEDEGFDADISLKVEVKTQTRKTEQREAKKELPSAAKLENKDLVAAVYDVKLIRTITVNGEETTEEIQPEDIKPGTNIVVAMQKPESVGNKDFRIVHIHSETDVEDVDYTQEGDTIYVTVDRLSEFAFIIKDTNSGSSSSAKQSIDTKTLIYFFLFLLLLIIIIIIICVIAKKARERRNGWR